MSTLPPALTDLFNASSFSRRRCAHLAVDVQERYVRPMGRECLRPDAERLAREIAPAFDRLGIPTIWVWLSGDGKRDIVASARPGSRDEYARKFAISGFSDGSELPDLLRRRQIDTIFVSGFYALACAYETSCGAAKLYDTYVMHDCIGINEKDARDGYRYSGARVCHSNEIFGGLARMKAGPP